MQAKSDKEARKARYQIIRNDIMDKVKAISQEITKMEETIRKEKEDPDLNLYRYIYTAWNYLKVAEQYIDLAKTHKELLGRYNDSDLRAARENFYKALKALSNVVPDAILEGPTDNLEYLEKIPRMNLKRVRNLIKRLNEVYEKLEEVLKDEPRYRLTLVELSGKIANIARNLVDLRLLENPDPRQPYYEERILLSQELPAIIHRASYKYREYYSISKDPFHMKRAIAYQEMLRVINTILNKTKDAEENKKTIDAWKNILAKDLEEKEKREGKKRRK